MIDVSFDVSPGEVLALVGPSGAGKTTLARLLLRFYDPSSGRILVDAHDLRDLSLTSLQAAMGALLQETLVFDATARENIAFARPEATDDEIERAARDADAHEFICQLPLGYSTRLGQRGRLLSGGQRQRIALARALLRDAPLLILDEPTTSLDPHTSARLLRTFLHAARGRTTIVISHSLALAEHATKVVVLDAGHVVEYGPPAQLRTRHGAHAALHRHNGDGLVARVPPAAV